MNLYRSLTKPRPKAERVLEEELNEDEDVQMEKARVKEALSCQSCEEASPSINKRLNTIFILNQVAVQRTL